MINTQDQYLVRAGAVLRSLEAHLKTKVKEQRLLDGFVNYVVSRVMPSDSISPGDVDSLLRELSTKRPQSGEVRTAFDAAVSALNDLKWALADQGAASSEASSPLTALSSARATTKGLSAPATQLTEASNSPMRSGVFFGMSIADAAVKAIELIGKPATPSEIWETMHASGFECLHNNPSHAVKNALWKRSKGGRAEALLVGGGKWDLESRYSPEVVENIKAGRTSMAGRDQGEHREKTKRGMRAAAERGVRFGATPKVSDEVKAKIRALLRTGLTIGAVAKQVGISPPTLKKYVPREEIQALWREARLEREAAKPPQREPLRVVGGGTYPRSGERE